MTRLDERNKVVRDFFHRIEEDVKSGGRLPQAAKRAGMHVCHFEVIDGVVNKKRRNGPRNKNPQLRARCVMPGGPV
jgi:hypothetical protein